MSSMNVTIIGSFVFRDEGDGCLTSKYHHKDSQEGPFVECAKLINQNGPPDENTKISDDKGNNANHRKFVGNYKTTWIETGGKQEHCDLTIDVNAKTNIYTLSWSDSKKLVNYTGTGMLFGELLVGAYWK